MFNLIIGGEPEVFDRWPVHAETKGDDKFPLSRMLEGTPEIIYKNLYPISPASLKTMEKLPALIMTEMYGKEEDNYEANYISVRVAKISKLRKESKDVRYSFEIVKDYGEVKVEKARLYNDILDLGSFGLNRTHWAVKDKDLNETLASLALDKIGRPAPSLKPEELSPERKNYPVITSVEQFIKVIFSKQAEPGEEIFYRGHSDEKYQLVPSLFRHNDKGNFKYLRDEDSLVKEILTSQPAEFFSDKYMLDKLVRMQHYGLPTRLLDITSNPLIALYFSCMSGFDNGLTEKDGQVVSFKSKKEKIKFFESDTVSCIANLAMLPYKLKNELSTYIAAEALNNSAACKKLVHFIREEKPYFNNEIDPQDLSRIIFVRGRVSNARIASQSGAFLLFGNDAVLPENDIKFPVQRIIIRNKIQIIKELARLNITEGTVYPGIEKSAIEIAKKYSSAQ